MIRPVSFFKNEETSTNNYYQKETRLIPAEIQKRALSEFDGLVDLLRREEVDVHVIEDTQSPATPDSIFPNNWISFHENGNIILYPMYAVNRRLERRMDVIETISEKFIVLSIEHDLLLHEESNEFLEGTGSLILDRTNHTAFAAYSERTHLELINKFQSITDFKVITFSAFHTVGQERLPIYHTNVMMSVGEQFAVICADAIDDLFERLSVIDHLENLNKEIILISESQVNNFAGNVLQIKNAQGSPLIVMSTRAHASLSLNQKKSLSKHGKLIHSNLETIETLGGGSARCMIAEIFLTPK
ncbi:MAG: amidinotransferase [Flammeovirgaceae bacterium]|nr:amidinotransferase [Flammeovirgaceae bacterium]